MIKELAVKYFGKDCEVRIFGSRSDDTKRGGDIDIYIESSKDIDLETKVRFLAEFKLRAGDQKIDLIVQKRDMPLKGAIYDFAKKTGIKI